MRVAVVVPTYNEAGNLERLAERLLALEAQLDVVVVDDASPDGTGHIADRIAADEPRFHVIHRTGPRGYSRSSAQGMRWALDRDFDLICTMDADLSHGPEALPGLLAAVSDGADLAIGSRYIDGGALLVDWGPMRRAVSQAGSRYARSMLGTSVRDCTSGFRCYRALVLGEAPFEDIRSEGYSFLIELLSWFVRRDATIAEVPITYIDRNAGASKISRTIIVEALIRTTGLGLRRLAAGRDRASGM